MKGDIRMRVREIIFIDAKNKKQRNWFKNLNVNVEEVDKIVETATGKVIGVLYDIKTKNPFKRRKIIKQNKKFLGKGGETLTFKRF